MEIKVTVDLADRVVEIIKNLGVAKIGVLDISEPDTATHVKEETPKAQAKVPTVEKAYSLDELGKAAIGLMDNGKQQDLINLLSEFGVDALPKIPKERYSDFALKLRELGADI